MRVLHLTTEFPPVIYGGLGTAVGGWVNGSARGGIGVGVLLVEGPLLLEGASGYGYGGAGWAQPSEQRQLVNRQGVLFIRCSTADAVEAGLALIALLRPDILHLHTAMLWHVAHALKLRTGTPLVYHVHSVDRAEYDLGLEPNPWLAQATIQEQAIGLADRLIAISASERALLETYYPEAADRVRVVGNGIDDAPLARFAAMNPRAAAEPLILYSGRLVERKGIRELLDAVPRVLERAPQCRFVLAGGPPPLSSDQVAGQWLKPDLEPCRSRIHFTGWLAPDRLADWYVRADVLVVPSRYEPFGMVILEGMLYGLPIAASEVGGPAEILEAGRTGLLFPPHDSGALAAAVLRLVEDPFLRARLGHAARTEVRARWAWPHQVAAMQEVYMDLLAAGTSTPRVTIAWPQRRCACQA